MSVKLKQHKRGGVEFISPLGIASYPHLNAPDTKFDSGGVYSTKLILDESGYNQIMEAVEAVMPEAKALATEKAKGKKVNRKEPSIDENEDGTYTINAKMYATGKTAKGEEFKMAPKLFDASGAVVPADTKIGSGSKLKLALWLKPYFNAADKVYGVSVKLQAVQVIELVEFGGGRSADAFGFGQEEGFSAKDVKPSTPFSEDEPDVDDEDEEDEF